MRWESRHYGPLRPRSSSEWLRQGRHTGTGIPACSCATALSSRRFVCSVWRLSLRKPACPTVRTDTRSLALVILEGTLVSVSLYFKRSFDPFFKKCPIARNLFFRATISYRVQTWSQGMVLKSHQSQFESIWRVSWPFRLQFPYYKWPSICSLDCGRYINAAKRRLPWHSFWIYPHKTITANFPSTLHFGSRFSAIGAKPLTSNRLISGVSPKEEVCPARKRITTRQRYHWVRRAWSNGEWAFSSANGRMAWNISWRFLSSLSTKSRLKYRSHSPSCFFDCSSSGARQ